MTDSHPDASAELRRLVKTVAAVLIPLGEAAAAAVAPATGEQSACQQVWCPVCATIAVAHGEQHPLATIVAEHGAALLSILRTVADTSDTPPPTSEASAHVTEPSPTVTATGYQSIPVIVHE